VCVCVCVCMGGGIGEHRAAQRAAGEAGRRGGRARQLRWGGGGLPRAGQQVRCTPRCPAQSRTQVAGWRTPRCRTHATPPT
jgi:hypothetical protein